MLQIFYYFTEQLFTIKLIAEEQNFMSEYLKESWCFQYFQECSKYESQYWIKIKNLIIIS